MKIIFMTGALTMALETPAFLLLMLSLILPDKWAGKSRDVGFCLSVAGVTVFMGGVVLLMWDLAKSA